ncbi:MAG: LamG-like jellyroll fold domain-containing protein [Melioribacteraceae bacterium]
MFENNSNDEADWDEVNNNGSITGSASYSNFGFVEQGDFYLSIEDSVNFGVFTVEDQSELDFQDENFAASLWIFPVKAYDNPQHLLMKGERSGAVKTNNYAIRINNQFIEFIVHSESGANTLARSSFKVEENLWSFIGVFYDYDNSKLYLWNNNQTVPIDTFDFNAPLFPNDDKLYFGTSGENGFKRFWGRIDDVRIGNKESDIIDNTTNVESASTVIFPSELILNQNYPNPFNPETLISFYLAEKGYTKVDVYNLIGTHIASLIRGEVTSGKHSVNFNANNLPSGVYFYRLQQGNRSELKKMLFIK